MRQVVSKYTLFIIIVATLIAMVSCEKDFKNIGVDMVDNDLFSLEVYNASVEGHNKNIEKNKTDELTHYMLGYHKDQVFGSINASIATQLRLTSDNFDFGENVTIDSVMLTIPYLSTFKSEDQVYEIDSLFSSDLNTLNLEIFELGTYLNYIDPNDPFKSKNYYNNDNIQTIGETLFSGVVYTSSLDTVMYINRFYKDKTSKKLYQTDTIRKLSSTTATKSRPFLQIALDKELIKKRFITDATTDNYVTTDNFQHYFRGLKIMPSENNPRNTLLYLDKENASLEIYYTNTTIKDEAINEDLNNNGIKGESKAIIPKAKTLSLPLGTKTVNLYSRDYTGASIQNYLTKDLGKKLFVQGASGSNAIINLFGSDSDNNGIPDELEELRKKEWLINDAKLYLYIDKSLPLEFYPTRLYLYDVKEDRDCHSYEITNSDFGNLSSRLGALGGKLVYDDNQKPDYYLFHLTHYISEIIEPDTELPIRNFGIMTYDKQLDYDLNSTTDTLIKPYNNNFKGVVLYGNDQTAGARRMKLELYYTKLNN